MIEDFCPVQKRQMDGNTRKLEENFFCKHLRENPLSLQTNPSTFLGVVYVALYRTPERVDVRTLLLSFHQKIFWLRMKNYTGDMIWQ